MDAPPSAQRPAPVGSPPRVPAPRPVPRVTTGTVWAFVALMVLLDLIVVGALHAETIYAVLTEPRARSAAGTPGSASGAALADRTPPCRVPLKSTAYTRVSLTYLDAMVDAAVTADELRAWFGSLPLDQIEVYRLENADRARRISFERSFARWPGWAQSADGQSGAALCETVRAELVGRAVGRPLTAGSPDRDGRHAFEVLPERRVALYREITPVGTLADVLRPEAFDTHKAWLEGR